MVTTTHLFTTADAPPAVLAGIRRLVDRAFAGGLSADDWDHSLGGWHVVVADGDDVLSHAAVVPRMLFVADRPLQTGYIEAVATVPERQRQGLGSAVMAEVATLLLVEFEMGALSTGRHGFYTRLGWERWSGPTFVRHAAATIRTASEDDGVMVLRFGPSADVELDAPITCEARRGDDW